MGDKKDLRAKIIAEKTALQAKYGSNGNGGDSGGPVLPDLLWPDVSVGRFLREKPPEPDYLLEGILTRGTVGNISAPGGTGKTYFKLQLGCSLATGQSLGAFRPTRANKVLYIGAEDPETELHRRIHLVATNMGLLQSKELANNMAAYSAVGQIGPLLMLDGQGNPTTSIYYEWLRDTIKQTEVEVLMLDPMSRLYGLNENDNSHGTFWVQSLERLAKEFKITILFAHHVSKAAAQTKNLSDSTGRGASSIRDGCRWVVSMREMSETDGKKYDVNPRDYVEVDITKANYTAKLPSSLFFRRGEGGYLEPVNLGMDRIENLTKALSEELASTLEPISRNNIKKKQGIGEGISNKLKNLHNATRQDIDLAINYGLQNGYFREITIDTVTPGPNKTVLEVITKPR